MAFCPWRKVVTPGAGADSSWLFILATTGVVGLMAYLASYIGLGWMAIKAYGRSQEPLVRGWSLAFGAVLISLGVASQFNNALFYTWILEIFWVLGGLTVALAERRSTLQKETR